MPRDETILLHGQRYHYTESGDRAAPALLLLHGVTGHARTWDGEARVLSSAYRVIALDQRGHGDSDPAPDGDYSTATLALDIAAFVDALGLRRVSVVGLSLGGRVAIAYAAAHPERVERLVVVDIGPDIAATGRLRVGTMMAQAPERFERLDAVEAYMRAANPRADVALLRERARHGVRALPDGGFTWKYDRALREAVRTGRWRDPIELWPLWGAIACPTLVVRGTESDVLSAEIAKQMVEALPHARLTEVAGAGHTVPMDRPAAFLAVLREFLGA